MIRAFGDHLLKSTTPVSIIATKKDNFNNFITDDGCDYITFNACPPYSKYGGLAIGVCVFLWSQEIRENVERHQPSPRVFTLTGRDARVIMGRDEAAIASLWLRKRGATRQPPTATMGRSGASRSFASSTAVATWRACFKCTV